MSVRRTVDRVAWSDVIGWTDRPRRIIRGGVIAGVGSCGWRADVVGYGDDRDRALDRALAQWREQMDFDDPFSGQPLGDRLEKSLLRL
jgi:hypothetical protein